MEKQPSSKKRRSMPSTGVGGVESEDDSSSTSSVLAQKRFRQSMGRHIVIRHDTGRECVLEHTPAASIISDLLLFTDRIEKKRSNCVNSSVKCAQSALQYLRTLTPLAKFNYLFPPIMLKHQLYALLAGKKSTVEIDKELVSVASRVGSAADVRKYDFDTGRFEEEAIREIAASAVVIGSG